MGGERWKGKIAEGTTTHKKPQFDGRKKGPFFQKGKWTRGERGKNGDGHSYMPLPSVRRTFLRVSGEGREGSGSKVGGLFKKDPRKLFGGGDVDILQKIAVGLKKKKEGN